jgi:hypothetical protein
MTAHEIGDAISRILGWTVRYLGRPDWYNMAGVDIIVALLDDYDLTKVYNEKPAMLKLAWPRNWFDRWAGRPWAGMYDLVLSSSEKGKNYWEVEQTSGVVCTFRCPSEELVADHRPSTRDVPVGVLRIATNAGSFQNALPDQEFASDYVFTGSYWGSPRLIMNFDPDNVKGFRGAVYGFGWSDAPVPASFKAIYRGLLDCKRFYVCVCVCFHLPVSITL